MVYHKKLFHFLQGFFLDFFLFWSLLFWLFQNGKSVPEEAFLNKVQLKLKKNYLFYVYQENFPYSLYILSWKLHLFYKYGILEYTFLNIMKSSLQLLIFVK